MTTMPSPSGSAQVCPRVGAGGGRMLQRVKARTTECRGNVAGRDHQHDEIIAAGAAGGKGTLTFQGRSYPFKLVGGVTGGGGAAETWIPLARSTPCATFPTSKGCIRKAAEGRACPCRAPATCGPA